MVGWRPPDFLGSELVGFCDDAGLRGSEQAVAERPSGPTPVDSISAHLTATDYFKPVTSKPISRREYSSLSKMACWAVMAHQK